MIPRAAIQAWATVKPWPSLVQVEQDLVLARLIVEIAEHSRNISGLPDSNKAVHG